MSNALPYVPVVPGAPVVVRGPANFITYSTVVGLGKTALIVPGDALRQAVTIVNDGLVDVYICSRNGETNFRLPTGVAQVMTATGPIFATVLAGAGNVGIVTALAETDADNP